MNLHNRRIQIIAGVFIVIIAIISFRIYSNIQNEKARAERMSQVRTVAVETAHAVRQDILPQLGFSGSLDPVWQAEVGSKIDGRLVHVHVHEGDVVTKGQVLAEMETVDTDADLSSAKGDLLDAQTSLRKAEADLARYEKLFASGAISQQTLDDYRYARDNAQAKLQVASGNYQSKTSKADATLLIAPQNGIVAKRYYQEGYYAKAGTAIFAIADISALKTTIHIPEGQIAGVRVGNEAQIVLPAYPGKKIIGHVTRIAPVADTPSHTFAAEVSVDNSEGLRAGVYANVELKVEPRRNVLTLPLHAIVMRDDQQTVFVADKEGVIQRKVLAVGFTDDKVAEILSGIDENDLVVVGGQNKLREGSKIKLTEKK